MGQDMPDTEHPEHAPTRRSAAKAARRDELLAAAARLMAERGYASVRLEDIGAAVGISGPAMYRHFSNKHDLLAQMLVDVSRRLLTGGAAVIERRDAPATAIRRLIAFHVDFALTEPDLIEVQYRDLSSLDTGARHDVRRLQRQYVDLWVDVLEALMGVPRADASTRAQAMFGLINSAPRLPGLPTERARELLAAMALGAVTVDPRSD
ncbi:putative transcriptional regulator, TetR family protein [Williamsia phyllosphaerae]|uniref:Transcriptional regulator, TetR family protein n=2 Tax=Williamsia phyllosphaerae TaxID=885042 RepID=A0ABQ1UYU5_9NOCA|nr:putative transcriptional regulator, TetR family protein [Williamsia phyllosphaerae]